MAYDDAFADTRQRTWNAAVEAGWRWATVVHHVRCRTRQRSALKAYACSNNLLRTNVSAQCAAIKQRKAGELEAGVDHLVEGDSQEYEESQSWSIRSTPSGEEWAVGHRRTRKVARIGSGLSGRGCRNGRAPGRQACLRWTGDMGCSNDESMLIRDAKSYVKVGAVVVQVSFQPRRAATRFTRVC
nr:hypothetical protein CFP56_70661 [Quercus suber]